MLLFSGCVHFSTKIPYLLDHYCDTLIAQGVNLFVPTQNWTLLAICPGHGLHFLWLSCNFWLKNEQFICCNWLYIVANLGSVFFLSFFFLYSELKIQNFFPHRELLVSLLSFFILTLIFLAWLNWGCPCIFITWESANDLAIACTQTLPAHKILTSWQSICMWFGEHIENSAGSQGILGFNF